MKRRRSESRKYPITFLSMETREFFLVKQRGSIKKASKKFLNFPCCSKQFQLWTGIFFQIFYKWDIKMNRISISGSFFTLFFGEVTCAQMFPNFDETACIQKEELVSFSIFGIRILRKIMLVHITCSNWYNLWVRLASKSCPITYYLSASEAKHDVIKHGRQIQLNSE